MHKYPLFAVSLLALSLSAIACNAKPSVDVPMVSIEDSINQEASMGDFEAQAVKTSGIVSELGRDDYPLTLFLTGEDNLKAYLADNNLTEEAFLASPKLTEFYKSQLIYADIDIVGIRSGAVGISKTFKSAAGSDVTIAKVRDDPDSLTTRNGEVNGVPASLWCNEDYNLEPNDPFGMICYTDAPIVRDFVW